MNADANRLEEVFARAVQLSGDERSTYLDSACGTDAALRERVEGLLHHSDTSSGFIRGAFVEAAAPAAATLPGPGTIIDGYRLVRELGRGGMGEVWLAEQTDPVRREVALKLIRPGMNTREVIARFEGERQALALMRHAAVAQVFDGGATAEGCPYLVMELVDGEPITEFCAGRHLGLRQRLELFLEVCEGVQHAHQKAIIHRDLKPSNILVVESPTGPAPKIIDFGIAKALDQRLTDATLHTALGSVIGTPGYMSPEQAGASPDIDTRADVYSLGAVLYELLTGTPPLILDPSQRESLDTVRRRISEEEPPRPSTRAREAATSVDRPDGSTRELRGELDWITMKALEKDRVLRYASALELAADVRRYLDDQPVLAGPPSTGYRVRKFVRRHRGPVAFAAISLALLVGFAITMTGLVIRVARERDRADEETAKAQAINAFLQRTLGSANPIDGVGRDVTVLEVLDHAAAEAASSFADAPDVRAAVLSSIGNTYRKLGRLGRAETLLRESLELQRANDPPDLSGIATNLENLAYIDQYLGRLDVSESRLREALALWRRLHGNVHPTVAHALARLAKTLREQGEYDAIEPLLLEALQIQRETLGAEHGDTADTVDLLATFRHSLGDLEGAERLHRENLAVRRRLYGDKHPDISDSLNNLATVLQTMKRWDEAKELLENVLELDRELLGNDHHYVASTLHNLATLHRVMGDLDGAERDERESLALRLKIFGGRHRDVAESLASLAQILKDRGNVVEAEALHREALTLRLEVLGADHVVTASSQTCLASLLLANGANAEAADLARAALATFEAMLPADHPRITETLGILDAL